MSIVWFRRLARDMLVHISLNYFTILVSRCEYSKCRKQNENEKISQIYSFYGFYPPLLLFINIKCYRTYCEFRLKMHFVACNMLRKSEKKSPSCLRRKRWLRPFESGIPMIFLIMHTRRWLKQCISIIKLNIVQAPSMFHCINSKEKLIRVIYWLLLHKLNSSLSAPCRSCRDNKKCRLALCTSNIRSISDETVRDSSGFFTFSGREK